MTALVSGPERPTCNVHFGSFSTKLAIQCDVRCSPNRDANSDIWAEHFRSAQARLDVDLLRDGDGVVHLDAEIPHRALDLTMAKE